MGSPALQVDSLLTELSGKPSLIGWDNKFPKGRDCVSPSQHRVPNTDGSLVLNEYLSNEGNCQSGHMTSSLLHQCLPTAVPQFGKFALVFRVWAQPSLPLCSFYNLLGKADCLFTPVMLQSCPQYILQFYIGLSHLQTI